MQCKKQGILNKETRNTPGIAKLLLMFICRCGGIGRRSSSRSASTFPSWSTTSTRTSSLGELEICRLDETLNHRGFIVKGYDARLIEDSHCTVRFECSNGLLLVE